MDFPHGYLMIYFIICFNDVYFYSFLEEISNQLIDSNAKVLFGDASMSKILKEAVQKTNRSIKIIYVTKYSNEPIPADGIRFNELIDTKGKRSLRNLITILISV